MLLREAINALQGATLVEDTVPIDTEVIEPPQQISPMEVVIPVRMDVSPEQAAMLQGSPSPPEASGEPSPQDEERSEGEGSGSDESSEEEESGDEGSDDGNDQEEDA